MGIVNPGIRRGAADEVTTADVHRIVGELLNAEPRVRRASIAVSERGAILVSVEAASWRSWLPWEREAIRVILVYRIFNHVACATAHAFRVDVTVHRRAIRNSR